MVYPQGRKKLNIAGPWRGQENLAHADEVHAGTKTAAKLSFLGIGPPTLVGTKFLRRAVILGVSLVRREL